MTNENVLQHRQKHIRKAIGNESEPVTPSRMAKKSNQKGNQSINQSQNIYFTKIVKQRVEPQTNKTGYY